MEESGANIATRAGEGDANVFNWQPLHQQVNQLIQRDIYHQRAMQDMTNKAALELKKAGASARPEDIPELTNYMNNFRTAGIQLLDPKVNRDPTQRAYWQKQQDESELGYHSLANDSKAVGKTLAALPLEYAKSGGNGFKPIDEFGQQLNHAKGLSTREIKAKQLDNPMSYMGAKELYPAKDYEDHVYGGFENVPGSIPSVKDGIPVLQDTRTKQPKNKVPIIVDNVVTAWNKIPDMQKSMNDDFATQIQTNPEAVKQTVKAAQEHLGTLSKEEQQHIGMYLQENPLGYEIAKKLLVAKPQVTLGGYREDPVYKAKQAEKMHLQDKADQHYYQDQNLQLRKQEMAKSDRQFKILHPDDTSSNFNTNAWYDAASNPTKDYTLPNGQKMKGRDIAHANLQALTGADPKNVKGVTFDYNDLLDPKKREQLAKDLHIPHIKDKYDPKLTLEQRRDYMLNDLVKSMQNSYPGQLDGLTPEHLKKNLQQIIIRTGVTKDATKVNGLSPTFSATLLNPGALSESEHRAVIGHEVAQLKSDNRDMLQQNLTENLGGNQPAPTRTERAVQAVKEVGKKIGNAITGKKPNKHGI
jgi:hypothetical protein